jgi:rhamnulokinase
MSQVNCLVFDLGASNGRAVVASFDGERYSLEVTHRFENRPVTAAGTVWWDILRLYSELETGIQRSLHAAPSLSSLGLNTWGVDFGFIDKAGRPLGNPVHYRDSRRNAMADEVYRQIPREELFRLTGTPVLTINSLFNLYAMKRDGVPELREAHRCLMMPDLFHFLLCGVPVNEYTQATTTMIYNQVERRWEHRILDRLGIPRSLFSEPVMPGTRIGALSPAVCRELEVPAIPIIVPGTHDTASAEAGIPVSSGAGDWAFLSLGTWGVVGTEVEAPRIDQALHASGFGNEGRTDGGTFLATNVTGLWIVQQCRQKWMHDRGGEISWDDIVRLALAEPRLRFTIDVDDPVFSAVHPDVPGLVAEWCTAQGLPAPSSIGETARCVYESLVLKFRYRFEQLARLTGRPFRLIHMVGGGTQCRPLCQWTADATGIPVVAGPTESTVAGNFIMQLKGLGEISSLAQGREMVARSSETVVNEPGDKRPWDEAYERWRTRLR